MVKICKYCNKSKVLETFVKAKTKSGYGARCKECESVRQKRWREANPEAHAALWQKWKRENTEYNRLRKSEWAKRNRESINRTVSNWRATNRDKVRIMNDNYRALVSNAEGRHSLQEWIDLLDEYGHKCLKCGSMESLTRDHVIPLSRGGKNSIDNIQPLCKRCNSEKWAYDNDYRNIQS